MSRTGVIRLSKFGGYVPRQICSTFQNLPALQLLTRRVSGGSRNIAKELEGSVSAFLPIEHRSSRN